MHKPLAAAVAALLITAATLGAQDNQAQAGRVTVDSLSGEVGTVLANGTTLRGTDATVYLWADGPELRGVLRRACAASRAHPDAWMMARTEQEAPSGMTLDSIAGADLALMQRIAAIPHAAVHADANGHFMIPTVPVGNYLIEAEMPQGEAIVQWWHFVAVDPVIFAAARSRGHAPRAVAVDISTRDFTRDQFCANLERPSAEFVFTPGTIATPLDATAPRYPEALRAAGVEGTVVAQFVVDSTGLVDMHTVRILGSPDQRFTQAVLDVLPLKRYSPAMIGGRRVRWATQQSFDFSLR